MTHFAFQKDSFYIKDSFYSSKGLLLHNKCTPFGMQKGYIYFSSVIFWLFSHYFSAFQPLFIGFLGSSDVWSDTILSISTNCRRLWRPRHSLSKLAVHIINNKNTQTNCTGGCVKTQFYGLKAQKAHRRVCQNSMILKKITKP